MNKNTSNKYDEFDRIEDKFKNQSKKVTNKYKVSGKSVFKLEKIIKNRTHETK